MEAQKIKTRKQYLAALERFEKIFQAKPETKEGDEAEMLASAVKNYEEQHYIIDGSSNMETKTKKIDTASFFRAIKEKLAAKMSGMTLEEQKDFMKKVREGKIKIV